MKKVISLIPLLMLGFSNAMFAASPSNILDSHAKTLEKNQVLSKKHCHNCCRGHRGHKGPRGPAGKVLSTFISLYALEQQAIPVGSPILFDAVSAQNGSITWPGANNGQIIVSKAGTYRITFGIQPIFVVKASLQVNNVNVPGGTLSIDIGQPFSGLTIDVLLPANATISIVNTGVAPMTLSSGGVDPEGTIAFLEIHKILKKK